VALLYSVERERERESATGEWWRGSGSGGALGWTSWLALALTTAADGGSPFVRSPSPEPVCVVSACVPLCA
jgi:hypothetical protein